MTLANVYRYFNKKSNQGEIEISMYDSSKDDNYIESFHSLVLENSYKGTLICLGDFHIKKNASFSGDLVCRTCRIEGKFEGSLLSTEQTRVCYTAVLDAKIVTASISIEKNARVKGIFNITKDIICPEPMKKLETVYSQSIQQVSKEQDTKTTKVKIITLRGTVPNAIQTVTLPKPEALASESQKQNVPSNVLPHPHDMQMNRSEDTSTPAATAGWW